MTKGTKVKSLSASAAVSRLTNPNPLCLPVSLSVIKTLSMMLTWLEYWFQNALNASGVASSAIPRTKSLLDESGTSSFRRRKPPSPSGLG